MLNWDATSYFKNLTEKNKLAKSKGFVFCSVSGMDGLEEALARMQNTTAFVCVSEINDCTTSFNNTPHTDIIKTLFFVMRHAVDDMEARNNCFSTIHELFRQFMTDFYMRKGVLIEQENVYTDDEKITLQEVERYAFSGCAVAFCMIKATKYFTLTYNDDEWISDSGTDGEAE